MFDGTGGFTCTGGHSATSSSLRQTSWCRRACSQGRRPGNRLPRPWGPLRVRRGDNRRVEQGHRELVLGARRSQPCQVVCGILAVIGGEHVIRLACLEQVFETFLPTLPNSRLQVRTTATGRLPPNIVRDESSISVPLGFTRPASNRSSLDWKCNTISETYNHCTNSTQSTGSETLGSERTLQGLMSSRPVNGSSHTTLENNAGIRLRMRQEKFS